MAASLTSGSEKPLRGQTPSKELRVGRGGYRSSTGLAKACDLHQLATSAVMVQALAAQRLKQVTLAPVRASSSVWSTSLAACSNFWRSTADSRPRLAQPRP